MVIMILFQLLPFQSLESLKFLQNIVKRYFNVKNEMNEYKNFIIIEIDIEHKLFSLFLSFFLSKARLKGISNLLRKKSKIREGMDSTSINNDNLPSEVTRCIGSKEQCTFCDITLLPQSFQRNRFIQRNTHATFGS